VLLLGGHGETKTLLAFGIAEDQDIVANTANIVTVVLDKIAFQWYGDNLGIGADLTTAVATTATTATAARGAATTARQTADDLRDTYGGDESAANKDDDLRALEAAAVEAEAAAAAAEAVAEAVAAEIGRLPKADNFAFSGTLGLVPATITVKDKVVQFGKRNEIRRSKDGDVLNVTVDFSDLEALASVVGSSVLHLEPSSYISLQPRKETVFAADIKSSIGYPDEHNPDIFYHEITLDPAGMTFTFPETDGKFPYSRDIDMVLDIVLRYRAFNRAAAGDGDSGRGVVPNATMWNIANGIYGEPDDSTDLSKSALNGGIVIRFGKGSSETGQGQTSVVMDPQL
jgi:hypothetical protein